MARGNGRRGQHRPTNGRSDQARRYERSGPPPPHVHNPSFNRPYASSHDMSARNVDPNFAYRFGSHQAQPQDFSFRVPPPWRSNPSVSGASNAPPEPQQQNLFYKLPPRPPSPPGPEISRPRYPARNSSSDQNRRNQRGRSSRRGRYQKHHVTDRPLLSTRRSPTPEQLPGMDQGSAKFKNPNDLSDSDEKDMEIDDDDDDDSDRSVKRQRRSSPSPVKEATPEPKFKPIVSKWCNPDPYTSLPPPEETSGKRVDFVKMIRKARNETRKGSALESNEDFIALGGDESVLLDDANGRGKGLHRRTQVSQQAQRPTIKFSNSPERSTTTKEGAQSQTAHQAEFGKIPKKLPTPVLPVSLRDRGPRGQKRTFDEVQPKSGNALHQVSPEWSGALTPWFDAAVNRAFVQNPGYALHLEINQLYAYLKPRDYEHRIRQEIIDRFTKEILPSIRPHNEELQVHSFGSFASGIYLPIADMDLVVISNSFSVRKKPVLQNQKTYYKVADQLKNRGHNSVIVIKHAKVPLVKFVDRVTGIRVDVSFENQTGLVANETYRKWRQEFPLLPHLVTLIKQMVLMRGLHEVHTQGLGGFAIVCLAASLMYNMPPDSFNSRSSEENLGTLLMAFLDFYGNKMDTTKFAVQLSPPGYPLKDRFNPKCPGAIQIIDPNNPKNDISSASHRIGTVLECFRLSFQTLHRQMEEMSRTGVCTSLLGPIFAGGYHIYDASRAHLRQLNSSSSSSQRARR